MFKERYERKWFHQVLNSSMDKEGKRDENKKRANISLYAVLLPSMIGFKKKMSLLKAKLYISKRLDTRNVKVVDMFFVYRTSYCILFI